MQVVKDLTDMNHLTIKDVLNADIVVVSFAVLSNDKYFSRLARLSGVDPASLPSHGGRHFTAVYNECLEKLCSRVEQIVNDCPAAYSGIEDDAAAHRNQEVKGSLRLDGKKAVYKHGAAVTNVTTSDFKIAASERDPWGLTADAKKTVRRPNLRCPQIRTELTKADMSSSALVTVHQNENPSSRAI